MVTILQERQEDAHAIRFVLEEAFGQSNEADLVDALRRRGALTLSLVALRENEVVGHIVFSPVTIESAGSSFNAIGLGPMAVLPPYQGKGIGSQLVWFALGSSNVGKLVMRSCSWSVIQTSTEDLASCQQSIAAFTVSSMFRMMYSWSWSFVKMRWPDEVGW